METSTSCYCEFSGNGYLDISEDEIYNSKYKTALEWLNHFIENDIFFSQIDSENIKWDNKDLEELENKFKQNKINDN